MSKSGAQLYPEINEHLRKLIHRIKSDDSPADTVKTFLEGHTPKDIIQCDSFDKYCRNLGWFGAKHFFEVVMNTDLETLEDYYKVDVE